MQPTQGHSHIKIALQDSVRIWHWEEEPPEHVTLKATGAWCKSSTGMGETEIPLSEVTQRSHEHWDKVQSRNSIGIWGKPNEESWSVSWGGGSWMYLTVGTRTLVAEAPGNINQCELSQRSPLGTKTQPHPAAGRLQC